MADQFTTFTPDPPAATTTVDAHPAVTPDLRTQDSHTYAGAVAQQKVMDLAAAAPTAPPTIEKLWDFYDKAYGDAENFKKGQIEANLAQTRQQQQKVWELTPQQAAGGYSPIQTEAAQRATVAQRAEQLKQGPSAAAASAAQGGAYIEREQKDYGDKISALGVDMDGLDRLSKLHDQMLNTAPFETGGSLRSWLGHSRDVAISTDPNAKSYFQLADLLTPTFGKGIQGDLPAATTKANILEMMDKNVIPNETDNSQSAHNKWFNLYNQSMDVGNHLRDQMKTEGQDTSRINDMLVEGQKWIKTHSDWDPVKGGGAPIVQMGTSAQSNQIVNSVNNTVNAAIGAQTQQPVAPRPNAQVSLAPPSYGAPQTQPYPAISSDPGTPLAPYAIRGLVNLPGQIGQGLQTDIQQSIRALTPNPGGPTQDLTQPPLMSAPNPRSWGQ